MNFDRMTENVLNISGLADKPTCTATELKGFFDKAGAAIKNFINAFIDQIEAETAAGNIGANISSVATKKLQAILEEFEKSIADRYTKTELETLVSEETNSLISDFNLDISTGVMTITKKDGTVISYDTALEKVPATFKLIEENEVYYLEIINVDGTSTRINVNNLFNEYLFTNSDEISFEVANDGNSKKVIARIKDSSIGKGKISLDLITQLEEYAQSASSNANLAKTSAETATKKASEAETSATNAKASETTATEKATSATNDALLAKSYAVGGTGIREGEDTDNAKYYKEQSQINGETDPTVPSWAKHETKPTYTADEVGAMKVSTVVTAFWSGTQEEYDAIAEKSSTTLYLISSEEE